MARVIRGFRGGWCGVVVCALVLMLQGCSFDPTLSAGAKLHCNVNSECPKSRVCRGGFCIDPTTIDLVAPELAEPLQVVPQKGRAGTVFSVALVSTKPLITTPRLTLHMEQPTFVECIATNQALHYRCDYTAIGTENSGLGGIVDFDVRLVDTSGNETVKRFAGTLQMDFSPPVLAAATVSPEVARLGATLEVFLTASEPLSGPVQLTSSVALDDGAGGKVSTFSLNADGATLNYRLTHVVSASDPTGEVAFTAVMTDAVGNTSSALAVGQVQIDATAPVLRNAVVTPSRAKVGATVTATFEVSKPLSGNPSVTVGSIEMVRDASIAAPNYRYTYTVGAQDAEGLSTVLVTGTDAAGNVLTKNIGAIAFDFTPPKLATVTALYTPAPSNVVTTVTKAKAGTVITVNVISDESLSMAVGPGNPPTLTATFGGSTLNFCVVGLTCTQDTRPSSYSSTGVSFEVNVPPGAVDGVYIPTLTWTDLAGNTGTASFTTPIIQVKTSIPVLAINQAQVTYLRSPWGNAAAENLGAFTIPSGPYFALAPANVLSNVATLPANTFAASNGALQRLRVWTSASLSTLLGTLVPNSDGTWPRQQLASLDVPTAYVTAIDEAGNESPAVKLNNVEWVATANSQGASANPNRLMTTTQVNSTFFQPLSQGAEGADGSDATAVLARAEPVWSQAPVTNGPTNRFGHAMTYDSARGRIVVFGGANGSTHLQDIWEWDGESWFDKTPRGVKPSARLGHTMVYDSARGRTVMFGGANGSTYLQDIWEWDGVRWVEKTPAGAQPAARSEHAMAYDSSRARVVMFGGSNGTNGTVLMQDIWEWDGASWVEKKPSGLKPDARRSHAMTYDSFQNRVVVFGGATGTNGSVSAQDIWEWDGLTWVNKTPAGLKPASRVGPAMAYDSSRQRVVMFGGTTVATDAQDVWEWDGTNWLSKTTAGSKPSARSGHAMTYDAARSRVVVFGDSASGGAEWWEWNGVRWADMPSAAMSPAARDGHAMVYDSARSVAVMFGGHDAISTRQDVWEWNGRAWAERTVAGTWPRARYDHAMAYDRARGCVVMYGGFAVGGSETWEWDGVNWVNKTTVAPGLRSGHAMAYDSRRGRVVMFGGSALSGLMQDTWEWDGTNWLDKTPAGTSPPARRNHAMVYDEARGRVVMFGGSLGIRGQMQDIWEWDGDARIWVDKTPPGIKPSARDEHAMAFDSLRGRVVMSGAASGGSGLQDVWEWDGLVWLERVPTGIAPRGREAHALVYDSARAQMVMFGGLGNFYLQDTWEWNASPARQPTVTFLVNGAGAVDASNVLGLRVRGHCGGVFSPYGATNVGATFYGWATGGPTSPPGSWRVLGVNGTGVNATSPWLPAPNAALIDWTATSTTEARQFILERDIQLGFQCRPSGSSGVGALEASVALDYIEVRVRYAAP